MRSSKNCRTLIWNNATFNRFHFFNQSISSSIFRLLFLLLLLNRYKIGVDEEKKIACNTCDVSKIFFVLLEWLKCLPSLGLSVSLSISALLRQMIAFIAVWRRKKKLFAANCEDISQAKWIIVEHVCENGVGRIEKKTNKNESKKPEENEKSILWRR